jgi:predicted enzyme related to lactoylglutathione lyase
MPNNVTHFEIFGDEPAKLAEFYRSLLGWQIEKAPGVDYWRIQTGPADWAEG